MVSAEAEEIGFTHAEIGEMLLVKWSFPEKIVEAVALHHAPWEANRFQAIPSIIYLANLLCNMNGRPSYVSELVPTREEFLDSHGAEYLRSNGLRIDEEMIQGFEEELNEQFNEASALSA